MDSCAVFGVLIKFNSSFLKHFICDLLVLIDILELVLSAFDKSLMAHLLISEQHVDLFGSLVDPLLDIRPPLLQLGDFFLKLTCRCLVDSHPLH